MQTCLHGVNLSPKNAPKVAAFDLDGTLIKWYKRNKADKRNRAEESNWEWWRDVVPAKIKKVHEAGYVSQYFFA